MMLEEGPADPPVLIAEEAIQHRIEEMGREISRFYRGRELTVVGALKGCVVFMADLIRVLRMPVNLDFIEVSSYGDNMQSSGVVKITKDLKHNISDRHVLLVEDIVDTGLTMNSVIELLLSRKPASLRLAAMIVKDKKHDMRYPIDFRGFNIEDHFVVGYGMDFRGYYRNLPYIGVLKENDQPGLF